jgi:hypothetical protein
MTAPTANTKFVSDGRIGIDISNITSACNYGVGETHQGARGSEYVYANSTGALSQGAIVSINADGTMTALSGTGLISSSNTVSIRFAFLQTAFLSSQFGFVQVRGGKVLIRILGAAGMGAQLYTTDTAGALSASSASASQFQIFGVSLEASVSASGSTASVATANVSFPIARFPKIGGG